MGADTPRLRVALVAPPWYEVPPVGYGGIEAVIADLSSALLRRGHEVYLIAAGRSSPEAGVQFAQTLPTVPPDGWRSWDEDTERLHDKVSHERIQEIRPDIVHDHWLRRAAHTSRYGFPTVLTITHLVDEEWAPYMFNIDPLVTHVAISKSHRRRLIAHGIECSNDVYNGLDEATFELTENKDDYVCYLGRFSPCKGAHLAIAAAREANTRIILAGRIGRDEQAYFQEYIEPHIDGDSVQFIGELGYQQKRKLLGTARGLLFPITWPEPFGMVMIEAMACGTPVLALNQGSAPEIIAEGETGFVCRWEAPPGCHDQRLLAEAESSAVQQLAEAIGKLDSLSPRNCRKRFEEKFTLATMSAGYEQIYRTILAI